MKAAMLKALGQPLAIEDIPDPLPGAGEVVVRVLAAPVLLSQDEALNSKITGVLFT